MGFKRSSHSSRSSHSGQSNSTSESQTSVDVLAATSFYPVEESDYNDLSNITEEADEPALDTPVNPTPSKLNYGLL